MKNQLLEKIELKTLLTHLPTGIVIHNFDTTIAYANDSALTLLNMTWEQIIEKDAINDSWHLVNEFGEPLTISLYPVNIIKEKKKLNGYTVGIKVDETINWVLVNGYINSFEKEDFIVITFTDITPSYEISFKEIVDKAQDAVVVTRVEPLDEPYGPIIEYVNNAFCKISGYSKEELLGKTPRILQRKETNEESLKNIKEALLKKEPVRETLLNFDKKDTPYWLDVSIFPLHGYGNSVTHFAAIERDISKIKESELLSIEASQTDSLTKLLNRRGFEVLVQNSFANNKINQYSIISLDIDNFKIINDTYGHDIGDKVLQILSNVILNICRKDDVCARMGGEEFTIYLPNVNIKQCKSIAERIRYETSKIEVKVDDKLLKFTISLGIDNSKSKNEFLHTLKNVDLALYKAKENGKNRVVLFCKES